MRHNDFIYLNVPALLENSRRIIPPDVKAIERATAVTATCTSTEIEFLRREGLIRIDSNAYTSPISETVILLSDLTEEGQDFVMSSATSKWLGACDRKSNDMLARGASEQERLAVYADPKGLKSRLEKFRKERKVRS